MEPSYIKQIDEKYFIKIGNPKSKPNKEINDLNNVRDLKINLFIASELTSFTAASLLNDLVYNNNNNYITDNVIMVELNEMFNRFIVELELKIKEYNLPAVLDQINKYNASKDEIWVLSFIDNVITYKITYNVNNQILINSYQNLLLNNKSIKKRIEVLNKNEMEKFGMNILWKEFNFHKEYYECDETNFILGIDPDNKLNLGVLKKNLINFKDNHYDINSIVCNIVKYLKVVPFEKYCNAIPMEKNYRLTPIVNNKRNLLTFHSKFPKDYNELSLLYVFRSVGIYLKFDDMIYLVAMILYSDYKIDQELEKYFKLLLNNNYVYNIVNSFTMSKVNVNMIYVKYILILLHTNESKSRSIFGSKYDDFMSNNNSGLGIKHFNKIPYITNMDIGYILVCVFLQNFIDKFKSKIVGLKKVEYNNFIKNKVLSILLHSPFTNQLRLCIINYIINNQNKICNENIITNANNICSKNKNIQFVTPYFKLDESNYNNVRLYNIYENLVFKNFLKKCDLCDEITFIDQGSLHNLQCKKHYMCNGCASKLYRTNLYNQGDYVNESNFVCSFCRHPEHNIIYQIPENFYENIANHRVCSFANCIQIVNVNAPQLCNVNNDNQAIDPIYCANHIRVMAIMALYSNNNSNNNSEMQIKLCPGCNVSVNKIEGCNHMKCNCGIHFCWVCDYSQDGSVTYNHPSYCRGKNSWEEGLNVMLKLMSDFYSQINDMSLNNNEIHNIYSGWLKDMLSSPNINAASYWDLSTWINMKLNHDRNIIIMDVSNITLNVSYICEWIVYPNDHIIYNIVQNIIFSLNNLKTAYPQLFIIPTEITILQYE